MFRPRLGRGIASQLSSRSSAIDVTPNQGNLLNLLIRIEGAKRVLELGTRAVLAERVRCCLPATKVEDGAKDVGAEELTGVVFDVMNRVHLQAPDAAYSSYRGRYIRRPLILRLERDHDLGLALLENMANALTH